MNKINMLKYCALLVGAFFTLCSSEPMTLGPEGSLKEALQLAQTLEVAYSIGIGYVGEPGGHSQTVHFVSERHVIALIKKGQEVSSVKYIKEKDHPVTKAVKSVSVLKELDEVSLVLYELDSPIKGVIPFQLPSNQEVIKERITRDVYVATLGHIITTEDLLAGVSPVEEEAYKECLKVVSTSFSGISIARSNKPEDPIDFIKVPFVGGSNSVSISYGFSLEKEDFGAPLLNWEIGIDEKNVLSEDRPFLLGIACECAHVKPYSSVEYNHSYFVTFSDEILEKLNDILFSTPSDDLMIIENDPEIDRLNSELEQKREGTVASSSRVSVIHVPDEEEEEEEVTIVQGKQLLSLFDDPSINWQIGDVITVSADGKWHVKHLDGEVEERQGVVLPSMETGQNFIFEVKTVTVIPVGVVLKNHPIAHLICPSERWVGTLDLNTKDVVRKFESGEIKTDKHEALNPCEHSSEKDTYKKSVGHSGLEEEEEDTSTEDNSSNAVATVEEGRAPTDVPPLNRAQYHTYATLRQNLTYEDFKDFVKVQMDKGNGGRYIHYPHATMEYITSQGLKCIYYPMNFCLVPTSVAGIPNAYRGQMLSSNSPCKDNCDSRCVYEGGVVEVCSSGNSAICTYYPNGNYLVINTKSGRFTLQNKNGEFLAEGSTLKDPRYVLGGDQHRGGIIVYDLTKRVSSTSAYSQTSSSSSSSTQRSSTTTSTSQRPSSSLPQSSVGTATFRDIVVNVPPLNRATYETLKGNLTHESFRGFVAEKRDTKGGRHIHYPHGVSEYRSPQGLLTHIYYPMKFCLVRKNENVPYRGKSSTYGHDRLPYGDSNAMYIYENDVIEVCCPRNSTIRTFYPDGRRLVISAADGKFTLSDSKGKVIREGNVNNPGEYILRYSQHWSGDKGQRGFMVCRNPDASSSTPSSLPEGHLLVETVQQGVATSQDAAAMLVSLSGNNSGVAASGLAPTVPSSAGGRGRGRGQSVGTSTPPVQVPSVVSPTRNHGTGTGVLAPADIIHAYSTQGSTTMSSAVNNAGGRGRGRGRGRGQTGAASSTPVASQGRGKRKAEQR